MFNFLRGLRGGNDDDSNANPNAYKTAPQFESEIRSAKASGLGRALEPYEDLMRQEREGSFLIHSSNELMYEAQKSLSFNRYVLDFINNTGSDAQRYDPQTLENAYRTSVYLYAFLRKGAMMISSVEVGAEKKQGEVWVECNPNEPIVTIFRKQGRRLFYRGYMNYGLYGSALWYMHKNRRGLYGRLQGDEEAHLYRKGGLGGYHTISFNDYSLDINLANGDINGVNIHGADVEGLGQRTYLNRNEFVYLNDFDPRDNNRGTSMASLAIHNAVTNAAISQWASHYFRTGAMPLLLVSMRGQTPSTMTATDIDKERSFIEQQWRGVNNSLRAAFTEREVDVQQVGIEADRVAAPELNRTALEGISAATGIPPDLVIPPEGGSDNARHKYLMKQVWDDNILPLIQQMLEAFEKDSGFPEDIRLFVVKDNISALQADRGDVSDVETRIYQAGLQSYNETRESMNMKPVNELNGFFYVEGKLKHISQIVKEGRTTSPELISNALQAWNDNAITRSQLFSVLQIEPPAQFKDGFKFEVVIDSSTGGMNDMLVQGSGASLEGTNGDLPADSPDKEQDGESPDDPSPDEPNDTDPDEPPDDPDDSDGTPPPASPNITNELKAAVGEDGYVEIVKTALQKVKRNERISRERGSSVVVEGSNDWEGSPLEEEAPYLERPNRRQRPAVKPDAKMVEEGGASAYVIAKVCEEDQLRILQGYIADDIVALNGEEVVARLTPPEDFHITIAYFPVLNDSEIEQVMGSIPADQIYKGVIVGIDSFDNEGTRAIVALLDVPDKFKVVQDHLATVLGEERVSKHTREWKPHITLAYIDTNAEFTKREGLDIKVTVDSFDMSRSDYRTFASVKPIRSLADLEYRRAKYIDKVKRGEPDMWSDLYGPGMLDELDEQYGDTPFSMSITEAHRKALKSVPVDGGAIMGIEEANALEIEGWIKMLQTLNTTGKLYTSASIATLPPRIIRSIEKAYIENTVGFSEVINGAIQATQEGLFHNHADQSINPIVQFLPTATQEDWEGELKAWERSALRNFSKAIGSFETKHLPKSWVAHIKGELEGVDKNDHSAIRSVFKTFHNSVAYNPTGEADFERLVEELDADDELKSLVGEANDE